MDVTITLIADSVIEPDETIDVTLVGAAGAAIEDSRATITIRNDDPRLPISGRVRFPAGMAPPASSFYLYVNGLNGDNFVQGVQVAPPDFTYRMPAVPRANVSLYAQPPAPYVSLPVRLGDIRAPRAFDLRLPKGMLVSGQVRVPAGSPLPTAAMHLDVTASLDGLSQPLPYTQVAPPDFRYAVWVVPGAWVRMRATPSAPYQPFMAIRTRVLADWNQDVVLSPRPGVVVWGSPMLSEGPPDTHGYTGPVVELSSPAPAGGVRLRYATVDGKARAGSDYTAASGILEFLAGEKSKAVSIEWFGDDELEGDEDFSLVLSDIEGAEPVVTQLRQWIDERDTPMSTPLPPETTQ